jgi:hypothetical protein
MEGEFTLMLLKYQLMYPLLTYFRHYGPAVSQLPV